MTSTFQSYVMSSITWSFDSP